MNEIQKTAHTDEYSTAKEIARTKPARFELLLNEKYVPIVLFCASLTALFYSISFSGLDVLPQLSFFIFCACALIILYFGLKKLNWLANRSAFLWGVPIMILAGFNAIFNVSVFHYFNGFVVVFLFAFIVYGAIGGRVFDFGAFSFWLNILRIIFGHITAGCAIINAGRKVSRLTKNSVAFRIAAGLCLAVPVSFIIISLMISGDAVFAVLAADIIWSINFRPARFLWHVIVVISATVIFAGWLYNAKFMQPTAAKASRLKSDTVVSITFLSVLNIIFAIFCYIQFAFLFAGGANTLPPGITYAEYAREGFFQLLFITIINFAVIIIFLKLFEHLAAVIRLMLLLLAVFTGVLIASSFYRMNMYIDVFGFTPLRLMVITFLAMETVFLAATLLALFKPKIGLLKFYLVVGLLFFFIANFTSTAYFSGRLNTARHFDLARQYNFDINSHFLGVDNAAELIRIYHASSDEHLRFRIRSELAGYRRRYQNEPWQSRSVLKRVNLRHIEEFLGDWGRV